MLTRSPFRTRTRSPFSPWSSARSLSGPPRQTRAVRGPESPVSPPSEAPRRPSGTSVCSAVTVARKSGAFSGAAVTRKRSSFSVSLLGGSPWAPAPTVTAPTPSAATRMRPKATVKTRFGIRPVLAPSMTTSPRADSAPAPWTFLVYPTNGGQECVRAHYSRAVRRPQTVEDDPLRVKTLSDFQHHPVADYVRALEQRFHPLHLPGTGMNRVASIVCTVLAG